MVRTRVWGLVKGSYVVPFGVCYGFWVGDYNIRPKKELHRRVWGLGFIKFGVYVLIIYGERDPFPRSRWRTRKKLKDNQQQPQEKARSTAIPIMLWNSIAPLNPKCTLQALSPNPASCRTLEERRTPMGILSNAASSYLEVRKYDFFERFFTKAWQRVSQRRSFPLRLSLSFLRYRWWVDGCRDVEGVTEASLTSDVFVAVCSSIHGGGSLGLGDWLGLVHLGGSADAWSVLRLLFGIDALGGSADAWSVLRIQLGIDHPLVLFSVWERWRVEHPWNSLRQWRPSRCFRRACCCAELPWNSRLEWRPSRCFRRLGALSRGASCKLCLESTTLSLYPWPPRKKVLHGIHFSEGGKGSRVLAKALGWRQVLEATTGLGSVAQENACACMPWLACLDLTWQMCVNSGREMRSGVMSDVMSEMSRVVLSSWWGFVLLNLKVLQGLSRCFKTLSGQPLSSCNIVVDVPCKRCQLEAGCFYGEGFEHLVLSHELHHLMPPNVGA